MSTSQACIQDDNSEADPGTNQSRGLVCICGFEGRILPYSDGDAPQTLPKFRFRGHLPVFSAPVQADLNPLAHSRRCSAFPSQSERYAHSKLSGRLADFSPFMGCAYQSHKFTVSPPGVPRAVLICRRACSPRATRW